MPKIIEEKPITIVEMKSELEKTHKDPTQQGFRSQRAQEYFNIFSKISLENTLKLKKEIEELNIPRLAQEHVVKICDLLPETADELKVILQGYTVTVTKESMQKICDCVKKYA